MKRNPIIEVKKWHVSIGVLGTVIAFILSNYWSYSSGQDTNRALLIDTLAKYNDFFQEVRKNQNIACDHGQLRGLYLPRFNSMLPVIKGEVVAPYDTPCPVNALAPSPPTKMRIEFNTKWDTWDDFKNDPSPFMTFEVGDVGILALTIDDEWKQFLIKWRNEAAEEISSGKIKCPKDRPCTHTIILPPLDENEELKK